MPDTVALGPLHAAVARPADTDGRPPLLLVHGMFAGGWVWRDVQRWLADHGWTSYAPTLRGRRGGPDTADLGRLRVADLAADLHAAARALAAEHAPPIVVGHSMGGLLAQKVAEAGEAAGLALLCSAPPAGISVNSPSLLLRQIPHLPALLRSRPIRMSRGEADAVAFNRVPEARRAALYADLVPDSARAGREMSLGAVRVDATRVRCPVLSVAAADDRFIAPRVGRRIAQRYHAAFRVFAGHGHYFLGDDGWEDVARCVDRWAAHVARGPAGLDALWGRLKERIGDAVILEAFDGLALRAEVVNVDLAAARDAIVEVADVIAAPPGVVAPVAGETRTFALSEIVSVERA